MRVLLHLVSVVLISTNVIAIENKPFRSIKASKGIL